MKKLVVLGLLATLSVLSGAILQVLIAFNVVTLAWWMTPALVVVGLLLLSFVFVRLSKLAFSEYKAMTPQEQAGLNRVGRKVGREVLDAYVEDREPNVGKVLAQGISDEL